MSSLPIVGKLMPEKFQKTSLSVIDNLKDPNKTDKTTSAGTGNERAAHCQMYLRTHLEFGKPKADTGPWTATERHPVGMSEPY